MSGHPDAVIALLAPLLAVVLIVACALLLILIARALRECLALARPAEEDRCGGTCRGHHAPRPRG